MHLSARVLISLLGTIAGCSSSSDGPDLAALTAGCTVNSDCDANLVCVFQRCHEPCASSRDCANGARCVLGDRPHHVCQLADEETCARNSDCPSPEICGSDGKCRDGCASTSDCLATQSCTEGICADASELVDGELPGAGGSGGASGSGGAGGVVIPAGCGNGQIDPGETCDATGDPRCDASCQVVCLSGEVEDPVTHDCYVQVATADTFQNVRSACVALDGDLAVPKDDAEQQLISMLDPAGWIGVSASNGDVVIANGHEAVNGYWETGTAPNGTSGCAWESSGGWSMDMDCTTIRPGLCAIAPRGTSAAGTCGDGKVDAGEECDAPGNPACVGCVVVCEGFQATKLASTHHCYFLSSSTSATWSADSVLCKSANAYLIVIDGDEEEALAAGMTPTPWISATDVGATGMWLTADGQPVPMTYWGAMQPAALDGDGNAAHCAMIDNDNTWHSADCGGSYVGVCERDAP